ncbi:MAG: glycine cleavage system protein T [Magnetovibrio sp.]|nr:glycine cleavage system protein T [Magnetovibrio sp.]
MTFDLTGQVGFGAQIRKSPFFDATMRWGCTSFSVYNHMYIPRSFGDPEQNFWNLVNDAILCDTSAERQVEITGPDAAVFTQLLTPRNLASCAIGQCKYVLVTSLEGGIINDPVLLRLGENHFWLSLADSDVLLWAKGLQVNSGLRVEIKEPDVSPLQLQGPKSPAVLEALFGDSILSLPYYQFVETRLNDIPLLISRTGWTSERGYEIFLRDSSRGDELWEILMVAGGPLGLKAGHTSTIRRVEGAMLSYIADMNIKNNPFEMGLERLLDLDMDDEFVGKSALKHMRDNGVSRCLVGAEIEGPPLKRPNDEPWPIHVSDSQVGVVTSAVFSPRLRRNIALALVENEYSEIGTRATVFSPGHRLPMIVAPKPFFDPSKRLAKE